jgi:hypothetical protein
LEDTVNLHALTRLHKWREFAKSEGRHILPAMRVALSFTFIRHQQTAEFNVLIHPSQRPDFFCLYPSQTFIRGRICEWVWDTTNRGTTRLWIPTELVWRTVFIGEGLAKVIPLDGTITGSAGLEIYCRPDCWWVSYLP